MTQVLISPMLMLMMWKHSIGPCNMSEMDPNTFLDSFVDLALQGLLPPKAP